MPKGQLSVLHEEVLTLLELDSNLQMHCVSIDARHLIESEDISPQGEYYNL